MDPAILQALKQQDDEADRDYDEMFGTLDGDRELERSPNYKAIKVILRENPILIPPCLNWLQTVQAQIANATLGVLYTPEQLEAMKARLQGDSK